MRNINTGAHTVLLLYVQKIFVMLPNKFVMFYSIKIKIVKQISFLVTGSL